MLIGWGSWSQRAARVAPRVNVEVSPHPGRMRCHPRIITISISLRLQQIGNENRDPLGRYCPARCGNPNATGWLLIGRRSWSQRAAGIAPRAATPGEDRVPSPSQKCFHIPTTPTRGRKRVSPRSIPPRTVWKPQLPLADWLGLMGSAPRRGLPLGTTSRFYRTRGG